MLTTYQGLQEFLVSKGAGAKIREAICDNKDVSRYIAQHMPEWPFPLGSICPHNIAPWLDQEPSSTLTKELERIMNARIWRGKVCVKGRERPRTFFIFRLPTEIDDLVNEDLLVDLLSSCLIQSGRDKQAVENARLHIGSDPQQVLDTSQQSSTSMVRVATDMACADPYKESDGTSDAEDMHHGRVVTRHRATRKLSAFAYHQDDTLDSDSATLVSDHSGFRNHSVPSLFAARPYADHADLREPNMFVGIPKIYDRDSGRPPVHLQRASSANISHRTVSMFKEPTLEKHAPTPSLFRWESKPTAMSVDGMSARNMFSSRKRPADAPRTSLMSKMQRGLMSESASMINKSLRTNRTQPRPMPSAESKVQSILSKVLKLSSEELLTAQDATEVLRKMRSSPCNCCFYDRRPIACQCRAYSP